MVVGNNVLTYKELVSALTKMYRTVEAIRGVPTGVPGPNWPNAKLRTNPGVAPDQAPSWVPSAYLIELSRLTLTHS
jgi:hypothetical protein